VLNVLRVRDQFCDVIGYRAYG